MPNWYDLPTYYDVSFSHEMRDELAFLKAIFQEISKQKPPKILEPACGTGRLIVPLTEAGFNCSGFDLNTQALDYLKLKLTRRSLKANIFEANMADFYAGSNMFDAAFCTVDTFRHLLSEKDAVSHLKQMAQHLKRNGVYILGLHLIPRSGITNTTTRWTTRRGRLTVKTTMTMVEYNKKKRTETLKVVLDVYSSNRRNQYESIYPLRTYTPHQFQKMVLNTGMFSIESVYDEYYDLSSPVTISKDSDYGVFVLRKKQRAV